MNHPLAADKQASTQVALSTLAALALAYFLWERSQTKKELIEEHESLIGVLRRGRKKELRREAKKQAKELKAYKQNPLIAKKLDASKWEKAKKQAIKRLGGRHSARAMQLAVKIYKDMGGRFSGGKGKSLVRWTAEKWKTKTGKRAKRGRKYDRYLPEAVWGSLSEGEAKATRAKKLSASRQYVPNTEKVKELISRKNPKRRKNAAFMKEDFRGFTTKKLQELEGSGGYNADTGLEVDPDALHEELMRRYESQGEKALKKYAGRARTPKDLGPIASRKNKALKAALRDLKRLDREEYKLWTSQPQFEAMPNPEVIKAVKSMVRSLKRGKKPRKASIKPCKGGKSFKPPVKAAKEAREGLKLRREYHRGGTKVGIARARDIANRKCLPVKTVKRMKSYFARHKHDNLKQKKPPSNGRIAWKLWGGNAGKSWTSKVLKRYE